MPAVVAAATVVGTIASVATGLQQASVAKKSAKLQKKRLALENQEREAAAYREKVRLHREGRLKRASVLNSAVNQGAGASSAASGVATSINTSVAREQGYVDMQNALAQEASKISSRQIDLNKDSAVFGGVAKAVTGAVKGVGSLAVQYENGDFD